MKQEDMEIIPEIVLLPGLDGTGKFFEPLVKAFDGKLITNIVSYPAEIPLGYKELLPYVIASFPEEKPFILLGESFSGPLAVMAGAKRTPNLKAIILVASFVKSPMPRWVSRLKPILRGPMLDIRPRKLLINLGLGRHCPSETRKWIHEELPRLKRNVLATRIEAVLDVNVREELKETLVPVLYIAASRDWVVPRKCLDAVWLCRPDVEVKVIDGPHPVLQCKPEDSAAAIIKFCSEILGSASSFAKATDDRECRVQGAECRREKSSK